MSGVRRLRGVRAAWRSVRDAPETVQRILPEHYPEVVFLFAQAYRAAAEQLEDVLIDSLDMWDEYERQLGEDNVG
ncbi:hypothetical protein [Actinomadura bangladeshensis]|uniref:Uncharacterized protein n=1 Tax=Actinomadura bangladeshensis TaxID=453573 RepID=A0A4R4NQL9_9ACTN|nr:hypothetical protein [Actinomadura bangladeshensis]TDC11881.1 hypothetical protein E1284_26255 [Actinomadura bangladeshensis]